MARRRAEREEEVARRRDAEEARRRRERDEEEEQARRGTSTPYQQMSEHAAETAGRFRCASSFHERAPVLQIPGGTSCIMISPVQHQDLPIPVAVVGSEPAPGVLHPGARQITDPAAVKKKFCAIYQMRPLDQFEMQVCPHFSCTDCEQRRLLGVQQRMLAPKDDGGRLPFCVLCETERGLPTALGAATVVPVGGQHGDHLTPVRSLAGGKGPRPPRGGDGRGLGGKPIGKLGIITKNEKNKASTGAKSGAESTGWNGGTKRGCSICGAGLRRKGAALDAATVGEHLSRISLSAV